MLKNTARFVQRNKKILVISLIALLLLSQVRTFISDGELLGFKVVERIGVKRGVGPAEESGNSILCQKLDEKFVSSLFDEELVAGTISADIKKPLLFSNCFYRKKEIKNSTLSQVVTVSAQGFKSTDDAQAEFTKQKNKLKQATEQLDFDSQAFFVGEINRSVFQFDTYVVNVHVNRDTEDDQAKAKAVEIANKSKEFLK